MDEGIGIASTLSDALTWAATTTATALDEWPTDQGDHPVIGSPLGDEIGPDDGEGSYFLVSTTSLSLNALLEVMRCDNASYMLDDGSPDLRVAAALPLLNIDVGLTDNSEHFARFDHRALIIGV